MTSSAQVSAESGGHRGRSLPRWIWLGLPPAVVLVQVAAKAVGNDFYRRWMRSETGVVEILTVLFLLVAVAAGLRLFALRRRVAWTHFPVFALLMAAGCFFFAGEEASWGQHWLGFAPPEVIAARNDQGEFNLHNDPFFEKVLDQLPRGLLTVAALVGGVLAPLWLRRRRAQGERIDFATASPRGWIWPTFVCFPAALFAVTISLPEKLFEATRGEVPYLLEISAGETKEFCLALFLMVYLVTLARELRAAPARAAP